MRLSPVGIASFPALVVLVLLSVLAARPAAAAPPGGAGNKGKAGAARVHWHCEGSPPLASQVCVSYGSPVATTVCKTFECYPAGNSDDYEVAVPKQFMDDATYSVWVGPSLGDLVLGEVTLSNVDGAVGMTCKDLPLVGDQGTYFCQDPRESNVSRNNTYYNKNLAKGGGRDDGIR